MKIPGNFVKTKFFFTRNSTKMSLFFCKYFPPKFCENISCFGKKHFLAFHENKTFFRQKFFSKIPPKHHFFFQKKIPWKLHLLAKKKNISQNFTKTSLLFFNFLAQIPPKHNFFSKENFRKTATTLNNFKLFYIVFLLVFFQLSCSSCFISAMLINFKL